VCGQWLGLRKKKHLFLEIKDFAELTLKLIYKKVRLTEFCKRVENCVLKSLDDRYAKHFLIETQSP
jgi:hypothetical protein